MKFLVISRFNIAFCEDVFKLSSALEHRAEAEAMVYVGGEDWEPLLAMARIGQHRLFENHSEETTSWSMMALPPVITGSLCLTQKSKQMALVALDKPFGEWAISALNGFCTAASDAELCGILQGGSMVFPIARWMPDHNSAVVAARSNYIKRFYDRYDARYEQTGLEQCWCDWFHDPFFEEREKRRSTQINVLQEAMLGKWERGWL